MAACYGGWIPSQRRFSGGTDPHKFVRPLWPKSRWGGIVEQNTWFDVIWFLSVGVVSLQELPRTVYMCTRYSESAGEVLLRTNSCTSLGVYVTWVSTVCMLMCLCRAEQKFVLHICAWTSFFRLSSILFWTKYACMYECGYNIFTTTSSHRCTNAHRVQKLSFPFWKLLVPCDHLVQGTHPEWNKWCHTCMTKRQYSRCVFNILKPSC